MRVCISYHTQDTPVIPPYLSRTVAVSVQGSGVSNRMSQYPPIPKGIARSGATRVQPCPKRPPFPPPAVSCSPPPVKAPPVKAPPVKAPPTTLVKASPAAPPPPTPRRRPQRRPPSPQPEPRPSELSARREEDDIWDNPAFLAQGWDAYHGWQEKRIVSSDEEFVLPDHLQALVEQSKQAACPLEVSEAPAPLGFVPQAAHRALPVSPIGRTFHADVRKGARRLGIQVAPEGVIGRLRVLDIRSGGAIDGWNRMLVDTFPDDAVRVGDYILRVNDVLADVYAMMDAIRRVETEDVFLVVWRYGDPVVGA